MNLNLSLQLNPNQTYVLAVSGGLDSMVLMDYLYKSNYNLVVVHFDHSVRDASILDKKLIESYVNERNIPFHFFKLTIGKKDFQNQARLLRKKHLEEVANLFSTKNIVTAHHLDDLAETILMKINRGSSLLGYGGMRPSYVSNGFNYLKPFLYQEKNDLLLYAKKHNIHFLEDASNQKDDYLRNRIRHHIIPLFKEENAFLKHIITFHKQTLAAYDFIRKQSFSYLEQYEHTFDIKTFKVLDPAVMTDVILLLFEQCHIPSNFFLINDIVEGLLNDSKPNLFFDLKADFVFIKNYESFLILPKKELTELKPLPQVITSKNLVDFTQEYVEICYNKLDYPLSVRRRKNGDHLAFPFGRKKLKSFLIDKKIPLQERDHLDLICDANDNIIWIPNLYLNQTLGTENKIYLTLQEASHAK